MKDLIKSAGKDLKNGPKSETDIYRPGFALAFSKKLNSSGYFFIVASYTLGVVLLTLHFSQGSTSSFKAVGANAGVADALADIKRELAQTRADSLTERELRDFKNEIIKELRANETRMVQVTNNIASEKSFRERPDKKNPKVMLAEAERTPASVENGGTALTYNYVNERILRKSQKLELERLEARLENEGQKYLAGLDMTSAEGQQKWADFQDRQEIEITAMKASHIEQRRKFKTDKYIVVDSF